MSGVCKDGVPLPDFGPCPECGAHPDQQCRTRAFAEYRRLAEKRAAEAQGKVGAAELDAMLDRWSDKRKDKRA